MLSSPTHSAVRPSSKMPKILVIDDDPRIQDAIEAQLYPEGYELVFKSSGVDAIRDLAQVRPDVILLDLMMPGMNGFDVCDHIKHSKEFRHIPIIMVTALDDVDYLVTGLDTGADEFISKPVNGAELRARVRSMLRIKHQYDELGQALQLREIISRMIVHDMRNPLSSILLYSQVIERKRKLPDDQLSQVAQIQSEALRLGKLFDDMLVLSRMQRGQIVLHNEPTDIAALLMEQETQQQTMAVANNIQLMVQIEDGLPEGLYDTILIERMIEILLTTAIKFAPPESMVHVLLMETKKRGIDEDTALVRLQISDQGPPLEADIFETIFQRLETEGYKNQTRPSTELGFAFCKMVIDAHGGTITITANQPEGVVFTIDLPHVSVADAIQS